MPSQKASKRRRQAAKTPPPPAVRARGQRRASPRVLIAAAQVAPNTTVLLAGMIPMRLRTMVWGLLAIAAYTVLQYGGSGQGNAGGEAAHLGGAAIGFLLIRYPRLLRGLDLTSLRRSRPPL